MNIEQVAKDRAALYLQAANLAAERGDEEEADAMERRAFDISEPFFVEVPRPGESVEPERAAGPDEVREMLAKARKYWEREERAANVALLAEEKEAVLGLCRTRVRVAVGAVERLDNDIAELDKEDEPVSKVAETDRIDRGLALWRERRADIRPVEAGRWRVPSGSSGDMAYLVDLQTGVCECRDYQFNVSGNERCKHYWAAVIAASAPGGRR